MIESVIGAIFTDSQGDLAQCQRFVEHIGLGRYLGRVCAERVDVEHPRNALQHLSRSEAVQYTVGCEGEGLVPLHHCSVSLEEELLAQVGGCLTKDEAVALAAETAKNVLVERRKTAVNA